MSLSTTLAAILTALPLVTGLESTDALLAIGSDGSLKRVSGFDTAIRSHTVTNGDFNTILKDGFYSIYGNDWLNKPSKYPAQSKMIVISSYTTVAQIVILMGDVRPIIREYKTTTDTWSEWQRMAKDTTYLAPAANSGGV